MYQMIMKNLVLTIFPILRPICIGLCFGKSQLVTINYHLVSFEFQRYDTA